MTKISPMQSRDLPTVEKRLTRLERRVFGDAATSGASRPAEVARSQVWSLENLTARAFGECAHCDCDNEADAVIEVSVNGVVLIAMVCDDHRESLGV